VRPDEVMNPASVPGPVLLLLDCPTPRHLGALRAAPALRALLARLREEEPQRRGTRAGGAAAAAAAAAAEAEAAAAAAAVAGGDGEAAAAAARARLVAVVHFAPPEVCSSPEYREFTAGFGPGARHIMAWGAGEGSVVCRSAATLQAKLNLLEPSVFPLGALAAEAAAGANGADAQQRPREEGRVAAAAAGEPPPDATLVRNAQNLLRLTMTPSKMRGFVGAELPPLALAEQRAGLMRAHPRVARLLSQFQAQRDALLSELAAQPGANGAVAAAAAGGAESPVALAAGVPPALRGLPRDVLEVVLLGTVSARPNSYRNVSSYYLDFFGRGGALADCGE
jgi:hypothetical protein